MICTLLRKPLTGTIIQTLTEFGGGMNIDASRVGTSGGTLGIPSIVPRGKFVYGQSMGLKEFSADRSLSLGRFPANLIIRSDPSLLQWFLAEFGLTQEGVAVRVNGVSGALHVLGGIPNSPKYGTTPGSVARYFKHCEIA